MTSSRLLLRLIEVLDGISMQCSVYSVYSVSTLFLSVDGKRKTPRPPREREEQENHLQSNVFLQDKPVNFFFLKKEKYPRSKMSKNEQNEFGRRHCSELDMMIH